MTQKTKLTDKMIKDWIATGLNSKLVAQRHNISYYTFLPLIKDYINTLTIDNLIQLAENKNIDFKFISQTTALYKQIYDETSFLKPESSIRQRLFHIKHKTTSAPKCKCCNNLTNWDNTLKNYRTYCSIKCQSNDPDVILSKKQTNVKNRGVEYPAQDKNVREKYKKTMINRYGISHVNKTNKTESINNFELLHNLYWEQHLSTFDIADRFGVSQSYVAKLLQLYNIEPHTKSCFEQQIVNFLRQDLNIDVILNTRKIIYPKEIDIFLPNYNIAIECNGLFWHSEISGGKSNKYHVEKTILCQQKNIIRSKTEIV
jgi:DNA-binding CsgD family transcriptional regulator